MKRRLGKTGIALIFGALSAIFGMVIGESIRQKTGETEHQEEKQGLWIKIE